MLYHIMVNYKEEISKIVADKDKLLAFNALELAKQIIVKYPSEGKLDLIVEKIQQELDTQLAKNN